MKKPKRRPPQKSPKAGGGGKKPSAARTLGINRVIVTDGKIGARSVSKKRARRRK